MPAVKISARLKLDENIERTNWCPSISGWTLTNYVVPERGRERLAIFQEFEFGFGHLIFCIAFRLSFPGPSVRLFRG
jgi:hypothetical protein